MTSKLKASFGDPQHGWIALVIACGSESIAMDASYVRDSLLELAFALHTLLFTQGERLVTWATEPIEYVMRFERSGERVRLDLEEYPGRSRLTLFGSYTEVCLPFWRALRALQGRYSEQEYQQRMHLPFPTAEVEKLTQALRARMA